MGGIEYRTLSGGGGSMATPAAVDATRINVNPNFSVSELDVVTNRLARPVTAQFGLSIGSTSSGKELLATLDTALGVSVTVREYSRSRTDNKFLGFSVGIREI